MRFLRSPSDLRPYQHIGVDMVVNMPGVMLNLKPGLGKTATTLTAIRILLDQFTVTKVLIVAPLLVAEETWPEEIESWSHTKVLSFEVITGNPERRESRLRQPGVEIHITNKENIPWLVEFWGDHWPYDMLVIDESSCFRNPAKTTKPNKKQVELYANLFQRLQLEPELTPDLRDEILAYFTSIDWEGKDGEKVPSDSRMERLLANPKRLPKPQGGITRFGALCEVRKRFERVVLLTGTMCPNGLLDLWSQFYLIDGGQRLGTKFSAYKQRWFMSDYMGFKFSPRPGAFAEITTRISDITLSMRPEDWITLPERIENVIRVHLPEKVMGQYRKFARTFLLELEKGDIEADNKGVLVGKLLQLASGQVYHEDKTYTVIHDLKLKALEALVEELAGEPLLVSYSFQSDLDRLRAKFKDAVVLGESEGIISRWNRGEIKMLLAHPASASYGLNLQHGGCNMVWYGPTYNLEHELQFNARLHRSGQLRNVIIHRIVAAETIDEVVIAALKEKDISQEAVVEATLYRITSS